jgi:hypothetical protein
VSFSAGNTQLGTATLIGSGAAATASVTIRGTSLAAGADTLNASYSGDSKYSGSIGSVTVTVASAEVGTTTVAAASPAIIAQNATTQLTAMVRPAAGVQLPAGTVSFAVGSTALGTAVVTASGSMAYAMLTVAGSKLSVGNNNISASYSGSPGFSASAASVLVIVTAQGLPTTTSLVITPASIAQSASMELTATVKAATGSTAPTGIVTFTDGTNTIGMATLVGSGGASTATLFARGSSLVVGSNSIVATYSGSAGFAGSNGSATVTVASAASNVAAANKSASP